MNYICTFGNNKAIKNIYEVWLQTLKKYFTGKIVIIITADVSKKYINLLKKENIILIQNKNNVTNKGDIIAQRLKMQIDFIQTLNLNDKVLLIDGIDVIFQNNIDYIFHNIQNKIYYCNQYTINKVFYMKKWMYKTFSNKKIADDFFNKIQNQPTANVGILLGTKKSFLDYYQLHLNFIQKYNLSIIFGVNQIILNVLIYLYSNKFQQLNESWNSCDFNKLIYKNNKWYNNKLISLIHFYGKKKHTYYQITKKGLICK